MRALLGLGRPLPLTKKTYENLGTQYPQLYQGLPACPHPSIEGLGPSQLVPSE